MLVLRNDNDLPLEYFETTPSYSLLYTTITRLVWVSNTMNLIQVPPSDHKQEYRLELIKMVLSVDEGKVYRIEGVGWWLETVTGCKSTFLTQITCQDAHWTWSSDVVPYERVLIENCPFAKRIQLKEIFKQAKVLEGRSISSYLNFNPKLVIEVYEPVLVSVIVEELLTNPVG